MVLYLRPYELVKIGPDPVLLRGLAIKGDAQPIVAVPSLGGTEQFDALKAILLGNGGTKG